MGPCAAWAPHAATGSSLTCTQTWLRKSCGTAGCLPWRSSIRPEGPQEFAYIPDDLLSLLYPLPEGTQPAGRPGGPGGAPRQSSLPASASSTTPRPCSPGCAWAWLWLSWGGIFPVRARGGWRAYPIEPQVLQTLLAEAGLLTVEGAALPEAVKAFLEAPRAEALATLARAWLPSLVLNELRQLPGLRFDGEWQNDPRRTRESHPGVLSQPACRDLVEPHRAYRGDQGDRPRFPAPVR